MSDVPSHLLKLWNSAEAFNEPRDAFRDAVRASLNATEADREAARRYGLSAAAVQEALHHKPRSLGERSLGDDRLGREVFTELARRLKR